MRLRSSQLLHTRSKFTNFVQQNRYIPTITMQLSKQQANTITVRNVALIE